MPAATHGAGWRARRSTHREGTAAIDDTDGQYNKPHPQRRRIECQRQVGATPQGHDPAQEGNTTGRDLTGLPLAPRFVRRGATPLVEALLDRIDLLPQQQGQKSGHRQAPTRAGERNPIAPQRQDTRLWYAEGEMWVDTQSGPC
jgi:hypothetical protein